MDLIITQIKHLIFLFMMEEITKKKVRLMMLKEKLNLVHWLEQT